MSSQPDLLAELVGECADRMATEGVSALEDICRRHPEHAAALRDAMRPLVEFGVVGQDEESPPNAPRVLGEFEILREIGRGGMGVVFEARQRSLDRLVALKVLHAHLTLDEPTIERFRREGRTAAALQHPGIVQVFGFGEEQSHNYLVMELVSGAPLDQVLARLRRGASLSQALRSVLSERGLERLEVTWNPRSLIQGAAELIRSVALALHHAHQAGVIHRDVKPSNILVRPDGQPVLTDFGLARAGDMPGLTRTGAHAGTPSYMSPEQAGGRRDALDHRTDVFSLGATLYETLTLQRPFPGDSSQQVMRDIQAREPVDPQRLDPRLPDDLAAITLRALEKDPDTRYPTAQALAEDLHAFLEFRPVTARKASTLKRIKRWMRREPLKAALVVLLLVGVPTIAALSGFLLAQRPLVEAAERQRQLEAAEDALMLGFQTSMDGQREAAIDLFRDALDVEVTRLEALAGLVLCLATNEEGAGQALALIEEQAPRTASPRSLQRLRALCLEKSGARDQAADLIAELGDPREPMEHFLVGWRLMSERYLSNDYDGVTRKAYDQFHSAVMLSRSPRAIFHHRLAAAAGDLRDEDLARLSAEALERFWPEEAFAWEGVALALEEVDPEAAAAAYRKAIELGGGHRATIHNNLANLLRMMGDTEGAIENFEKSIELRENNSYAHFGLSRVHLYMTGDMDQALEHAREAARLAGDDPAKLQNHRMLVRVLGAQGKLEEAAQAADAAMELLPQATSILRDLANVYLDAGQPDSAARVLDRVLSIDARDERALQALADVRTAQGDPAGAVDAMARRTEILSDDPEAWRLLAVLRLAVNPDGSRFDPHGALVAARRAAELSPGDDPWVLLTLGTALQSCNELDEALATLEHGLELARQSAQELVGHFEQAIAKIHKDR